MTELRAQCRAGWLFLSIAWAHYRHTQAWLDLILILALLLVGFTPQMIFTASVIMGFSQLAFYAALYLIEGDAHKDEVDYDQLGYFAVKLIHSAYTGFEHDMFEGKAFKSYIDYQKSKETNNA